jgi:hypothetical protein
MPSAQALLMEPVPIMVLSVLGSTLSTGGVTTVTIPAHADGDLIIAFGSNRTNTVPPTPAGWTSIATGTLPIQVAEAVTVQLRWSISLAMDQHRL